MKKDTGEGTQKAQAFVGVLVILVIILGICVAAHFYGRSLREVTALQIDEKQAYALAKSGLDIGASLIPPPDPCVESQAINETKTYNIGAGKTMEIKLVAAQGAATGTITSTGKAGRGVRTLTKAFNVPQGGSGGLSLPKTGQEISYTTNDDADYADPVSEDVGYTRGEDSWAGWNADGGRFTKKGSAPDMTIIDNATGLEWVADPCDAGILNGTGACFGWYNWAGAITACEGLTYATYSDWRLPNIKELMSIVDYGTSSPSIDTNFFACQQVYYWTSTTSPVNSSDAYVVYFYDGLGSSSDKTTSGVLARPVRGGSEGCTTGLPKTGQEISYTTNDDADYADPVSEDVGYTRGEGTWAGWNENGGRFTKEGTNPNLTIIDNATGLEWVANPTNAGVGGTYTWANAITACENLTYPSGGYNDWRLPNVKELMSIVDYGTSSPSIDTNFFSCVSNNYWTSTSYTPMPGLLAWAIYFGTQNFSTGDVNPPSKSFPYYLRPVRGGQAFGSPPEPPPEPSGTITNLRIVVRYIGTLQRGFRLNNTDSWYPGTTSAWGTYGDSDVSWSPSRPGGGDWTWADVSNLQVIVRLQTGRITQVYVIVEATGGNITIRPNGQGYYNGIVNPPASPHWALVDDVVPDDDATYVWTGSGGYETDSYELTNPP